MPRIKYQEAIGQTPKRGRPALAVSDAEKARLHRLYIIQGLSVRDLGRNLGIGEKAVRLRLHAAGVPMRSNAKRPRLRYVDPVRVYSDVILHGVEGAAKRLKMTKRALQYHLSRLRREAKSE